MTWDYPPAACHCRPGYVCEADRAWKTTRDRDILEQPTPTLERERKRKRKTRPSQARSYCRKHLKYMVGCDACRVLNRAYYRAQRTRRQGGEAHGRAAAQDAEANG